jgi:hypothetical protein
MTNRWTVLTKEDPETGDVILPFPDDMLQQLGWLEGDVLDFDIKDDCVILVNTTHSKRINNV